MQLAPRHEVVAVDINPVQLAYAEGRFAGDHGVRGTAERVMAFGRAFAPAVGWSPSRLHAFLDLDDPGEQIAYWRQHLDTWRFRTAFDGFFSLAALRAVYAPQFLDFLPPRLGSVMRERMERCFVRHPNRTNVYARALLLGELSDPPPPPEAKKIRIVHADAAECLEREPAESFDGFALSNILDGAATTYERRLIEAVKRAAAPGAIDGPPQLSRGAHRTADQPRCRGSGDALGHRRREAGRRTVSTNDKPIRDHEMKRATEATDAVVMDTSAAGEALAMTRPPRSILTRMKFAASPERVWGAMMFYEQIDERPPMHLRLLLPLPIRTESSNAKVGDRVTCLYEGGHLVKCITQIDHGRHYAFEVVEQNLVVGGGLRLSGGSYVLSELPDGGTEVAVTTRYLGVRRPRLVLGVRSRQPSATCSITTCWPRYGARPGPGEPVAMIDARLRDVAGRAVMH